MAPKFLYPLHAVCIHFGIPFKRAPRVDMHVTWACAPRTETQPAAMIVVWTLCVAPKPSLI
eukprot:6181022-Pleurochrysis_carterae.AAC.2